jgi:predicted ATPase
MRATIAWSEQLLTPEEQALFVQLGVFTGGWTLAAAEAVCRVDGGDVATTIEALVAHSLVRASDTGGARRFTMLETVRAYALELLVASGKEHAQQERHAEWCLALAEEAEPKLRSGEQIAWLARLDQDYDNFQAALTWCRNAAGPDAERRSLGLGAAARASACGG